MHFVHGTIIMHERPTCQAQAQSREKAPHPMLVTLQILKEEMYTSGLAELQNWAGQGGRAAGPRLPCISVGTWATDAPLPKAW